jgi:hypothetical protein
VRTKRCTEVADRPFPDGEFPRRDIGDRGRSPIVDFVMTTYRLNPSKTLAEPANGRAHAMTEVFLLLACQANASQLKFALNGDSLRIAQVVDGTLYEFVQPPDCVRAPLIEQLRRIFSMSAEQTRAECELQLGTLTANAQIEFRNGGVVVTIIRNFEERTILSETLNRFWRDNAASQGFLVLARYYVMEVLWALYNMANKTIHPSRGTAAA